MAKWLLTNGHRVNEYWFYDLKKDNTLVLTDRLYDAIRRHVDRNIQPGDTYQEDGIPEMSYEAYMESNRQTIEFDEKHAKKNT